MIAKEAQATFFWTEVAATVVHVGLAFILVPYFGAAGAGMAFLGLYVWHGVLIYGIVRKMSGFRWSRENAGIAPVFILACVLVFLATQALPLWQSTVVGLAALLLTGLYAIRKLVRLVPHSSLPSPLKVLIARFA